MSRLDHTKPLARKNKDNAKADADFLMFSAMPADQAVQWVETHCTADAETMKILKLMMRTFTAIAGDL